MEEMDETKGGAMTEENGGAEEENKRIGVHFSPTFSRGCAYVLQRVASIRRVSSIGLPDAVDFNGHVPVVFLIGHR